MLLVGVHTLVRATLDGIVERRFVRNLNALERIVTSDRSQLPWYDAHGNIDYFSVSRTDGFAYSSAEWTQARLTPEATPYAGLSRWARFSPPERMLRARTRTVPGRGGRGVWTIRTAQDISPHETALQQLKLNLLFATPVVLLLVGVSGHVMAGRVLSPIGAMAARIRRITAENLAERLPVANPRDEVGQLALVINRTLEQLEESFARLRRFTADASHELRTPLTVIRTVGEVGLAEPFEPAKCRDALVSVLEESGRMTRLVEGLLLLAKADANVVVLKAERLRPFALCQDIADLLQVLAEEKGQRILVAGDDAVEILADRSTLRQAVINIVDNAIRYTPSKGAILMETGVLPSSAPFIAVHDEGPGIAPDDRDRIFDRFFRSAESRQTAGCGLGLAIAKWAAEANGAAIEAMPRQPRGTTFRIVFAGSSGNANLLIGIVTGF